MNLFVVLLLLVTGSASGKQLRYRRDKDRSSIVNLKEVTGAFEVEIGVRFDSVNNHWKFSSQKVFDFGDSRRRDNIYLGQEGSSSTMVFGVYKNGVEYKLLARNSIVKGEEAKWKVGVDEDGLMWIDKDGTRLAQSQGVVPSNVVRSQKLLGQSTSTSFWKWLFEAPLDGAILGIRINNVGEYKDFDFLNLPGQLKNGFTFSVYGRFNKVTQLSGQKLFDFTTAGSTDSVSLGQWKKTRHIVMQVEEEGQIYSLLAKNSIDPGTLAFWECGVDDDGNMWITKNGVRLASGPGKVPKKVFRRQNRIGKSHSAEDPINGVVLGLRVELTMVS